MPDELSDILHPDLVRAATLRHPYALLSALGQQSDAKDPLDCAIAQYLRLYLTGDVLVKVDRASMACGLEVRAPLLDTNVVEFAAAMPPSLKLSRLRTKYVLRKLAATKLPREIVRRPKKGFGVPIAGWLKGPLRALATDLLSAEKIRREGLLNDRAVERLLSEHLAGVANHRKPLWTLIAFELWLERFGPGAQKSSTPPDRVHASVMQPMARA